MLSSWSSRRAWTHRASLSMVRLGPSHLMAAKSRLVSLFRLAQRTKFPASTRAVACVLACHCSRSPCPALVRSRPLTASQSSADLMFRWTATRCPFVACLPLLRRRKPVQRMPEGVAVQQGALFGIGAVGNRGGEPAFEPHQVLVATGVL